MWVKTLNGEDVFEQGDGWIYWARTQGWTFEPNLLTAPAQPMGVRVRNEIADMRSRKAPTLHQAWSLKTTHVRGVYDLLRLYVLVTAGFIVWHIPLWIHAATAKVDPRFADASGNILPANIKERADGALATAIIMGVLALFALWIIWLDNLEKVDSKKAWTITGAVLGAVAVHRIDQRIKALERGLTRDQR